MWVSYTDNQCEQITCPPVCGGGLLKENVDVKEMIFRKREVTNE